MTTSDKDRKLVIGWLSFCSLLVFSMVLLGGAVRLTGSGLSMVDWRPLIGIIPPIGEMAWMEVFEQYKRFPEYQVVNGQMNLSEFKFIFLMEYAHRVLGRVIGLVFFLPFLFFLVTKRLSSSLAPRLWVLLFLGAIQGGVGWYMVKSGLVNDPHVSQYRLTLHFMIAVAIYSYMLRLIIGLTRTEFNPHRYLRGYGIVVLGLLLLMMTTGGFVAGTKAGFMYNTYPKMGLDWIPDQLWTIVPFWKNFFENPVTIQFVHRWLAVIIFGVVVSYGILISRTKNLCAAVFLGSGICLVVCIQVTLGVYTLLNQVPPVLGVSHQAGALALLSLVIFSVSLMLPKIGGKPGVSNKVVV